MHALILLGGLNSQTVLHTGPVHNIIDILYHIHDVPLHSDYMYNYT
jgi:hypothetical protein